MSPDMVVCDGDLTIDTTSDPGKVMLSCSGPLSFGDGALASDGEVVITAPSIIFVGELTLDVPEAGLVSGQIMAGSNAKLSVRAAPTLTTDSSPSIASGATISIAGGPTAPMTHVDSGGRIQLASGAGITVEQFAPPPPRPWLMPPCPAATARAAAACWTSPVSSASA